MLNINKGQTKGLIFYVQSSLSSPTYLISFLNETTHEKKNCICDNLVSEGIGFIELSFTETLTEDAGNCKLSLAPYGRWTARVYEQTSPANVDETQAAFIGDDTIDVIDACIYPTVITSCVIDGTPATQCNISVTANNVPPTTNGGSDGSATMIVVSEAGNVTYLWDDPLAQTTITATGLTAGTYIGKAFDDILVGCQDSDSTTLIDPPALSFLFKTKNAVASTFTITYSGTGTPAWDDSVTIETGTTVAFSGGAWTTTAEKTVVVSVGEIENIDTIASNWINKGLTELHFENLSSLGGDFQVQSNPLLTVINNPTSSVGVAIYYAYDCNITGVLDVSTINLSGNFRVYGNSLLTGITNPSNSNLFVTYYAYSCGLVGNLNMSSLGGLGGDIRLQSNPLLTSVAFPSTSQTINYLNVGACDITGICDISGLTSFEGQLFFRANSNLTGLTLPTTSGVISFFDVYDCDLTGTLDVSGMTGLGGYFRVYGNSNLTSITNPTSSETFNLYYAYNCGLNGLDFSTLSGLWTKNNTAVRVDGNGMSEAQVDSTIASALAVSSGSNGTGCTFNIAGTNSAPSATGLTDIALLELDGVSCSVTS